MVPFIFFRIWMFLEPPKITTEIVNFKPFSPNQEKISGLARGNTPLPFGTNCSNLKNYPLCILVSRWGETIRSFVAGDRSQLFQRRPKWPNLEVWCVIVGWNSFLNKRGWEIVGRRFWGLCRYLHFKQPKPLWQSRYIVQQSYIDINQIYVYCIYSIWSNSG